MKRDLGDGYELDDDPARIDREAAHRYLTQSYWASGRPREVQDALIDGAARVVGLYHDGEQVGFSRTLSDGYSQSYLADVYVLDEHRGRGLGIELVRFSVDEGPLAEHEVVPAHARRARSLPQVRIRRAGRASARAPSHLMSVVAIAGTAMPRSGRTACDEDQLAAWSVRRIANVVHDVAVHRQVGVHLVPLAEPQRRVGCQHVAVGEDEGPAKGDER